MDLHELPKRARPLIFLVGPCTEDLLLDSSRESVSAQRMANVSDSYVKNVTRLHNGALYVRRMRKVPDLGDFLMAEIQLKYLPPVGQQIDQVGLCCPTRRSQGKASKAL